ncbi:N-ethylammeline chlorohydrolase [Sulfolobales archaeon HS-7]|nr:N-ethylammeline chlorohydrolase [Sulfolobales archaeon HS-7]
MELTLRHCDFIVSADKIYENTNLVIQGNTIKTIGDYIEGDELECKGKIVIPGLVNTHTHLGMTFLRGYYDDADFPLWIHKMWESERKATREILSLSTEIAILEAISSGTTAIFDMYFNPEDVKEFSNKYGIRTYGGYVFLDSRNDPFEIDKLNRMLKPTELFTPIINIHSIYSTSETTLKLASQLAREANRKVQIHMSETREEVFNTKKKYGMTPIQYLNKLVDINEKWELVHLGWVTNWEIEILKRVNATAVHCPTSNMKLATAGTFPMRTFLEEGINVTLGTDGPASNNSLDMFREMKTAVLLQRNTYWNYDIGAKEVISASTRNGYRYAGLNAGYVKEGWLADLVVLDSKGLRPLSKERVLSSIVYNAVGENVDTVIVNGQIVYKKGMFNEKLNALYAELEGILFKGENVTSNELQIPL